jgi:uncharacterized membrane protein
MNALWPPGVLIAIVIVISLAHRQPTLQPIFRWLPVPLWCYALPVIAVALGCLPSEQPEHPVYRPLTNQLLPFALGSLLLGVDLPSIMRAGGRALIVAMVGAVGIVVGAPLGVWILQPYLPPDAWKGAGTLAGTWTGGTMNLLALRSVLETPEAIFAPLVVVDAMIAYSWMALLVAASGFQRPINRWLQAPRPNDPTFAPNSHSVWGEGTSHKPGSKGWRSLALCALVTLGLVLSAHALAVRLPRSHLVNSATGWTVLLVTTTALCLSLVPKVRRLGESGSVLGYPCLYLVLAATGAQARLDALRSTPVWIVLGVMIVVLHGGALLLAGRLLRVPLGMLATASQANIGGVVSAPLVGAVYHQSLAPVGLLLAMAGNAFGTHLGWLSATLCRWLMHS